MTTITNEIAAQVLWHYGYGDRAATYAPSGFAASLLSTISRADQVNRVRLALGFPGHVAACNLIEQHTDGVATLLEIAAGVNA